MKAVILGAGYATRLYPLTLNTPKPLLPIKGTPILELIIKQLRSLAEKDILNEIIVVSNAKYFDVYNEWKEKFSAPTKLTILNNSTHSNEKRLGAVGDLLFAANKLDINEDIFLIAGDNLFKTDAQEMYAISQEKNASVIATYDLEDPKLLANKFGVVQVDADNKILSFEEKPPEPKSSLTATAIYLIKQDDLQKIKELIASNEKMDNMGNMIEFLVEKSTVYIRPIDYWVDIGGIEEYEAANK